MLNPSATRRSVSEVPASTDEGHLEVVLVDVVDLISVRTSDLIDPRRGLPENLARTKWPMRALAMTGMVTAALMALIMVGRTRAHAAIPADEFGIRRLSIQECCGWQA
jgi:hypothetical protein